MILFSSLSVSTLCQTPSYCAHFHPNWGQIPPGFLYHSFVLLWSDPSVSLCMPFIFTCRDYHRPISSSQSTGSLSSFDFLDASPSKLVPGVIPRWANPPCNTRFPSTSILDTMSSIQVTQSFKVGSWKLDWTKVNRVFKVSVFFHISPSSPHWRGSLTSFTHSVLAESSSALTYHTLSVLFSFNFFSYATPHHFSISHKSSPLT